MRDLFFLTCGGFVAPGGAVRPLGRGSFSPTRLVNTVAVAVRHNGDLVLVDAGFSAYACASSGRSLGRLTAWGLGVRVGPEDAIASQLRRLGFDPERVRVIVATHLHLDHVGGVEDFPNAEVVVSQSELKAYWNASSGIPYRARDLASAGRIRTVALDETPSYGFPGSADLFDDGKVVLLDAAGHTPGSIAVALRGPKGTYVHVGDAVYQRWEYDAARHGPSVLSALLAWRRPELARTRGCLRACEADPRRPVVVSSHDAEVFARLPQKPTELAR
jgi:glyoxylase-like metal-dependent hydrolase (beta-lactamase superfamily II)